MINNIYSVAIVDDDATCINNLQQSIAQFPELKLVATSQLPSAGKADILKHQPSLLFLDVEMPEQTGLELLTEMQDTITWNMQVVFYTAYDKYLLGALRASAFDYLLKPYTDDEFNVVIHRFLKQATKTQSPQLFKETISALLPEKRRFMIATATGYQLLRTEDIGYFEYHSIRKIWFVTLEDSKKLQLKRGTKADDILGLSSSFIQISQQHIINFDYLSFIDGQSCLLSPPFESVELKISRNYLKLLQERFESI